MIIAPPHPDEARRLQRLRELAVLDTAPEPLFDTLAALAGRICGTPIALLSLVDEKRQWFKANVGLPGVNEGPRELAFCSHAILHDGLFEVPDAQADARFADHPAVSGAPRFRSYAAVPVALEPGLPLGTLCVVDYRPLVLSAEQRAQLALLAQAAADALRQRERVLGAALAARSQLERELADDRQWLNAILDALPASVSVWNRELRLVYANAELARRYGSAPDALRGMALQDLIGPERTAVAAPHHVHALAGRNSAFDLEVRTVDGPRSLQMRLLPWRGTGDAVRGVIALGLDMTAERQARARAEAAETALRGSEALFHALAESSPLGVFHTDAAGHCTYTNPRWQEMYGLTLEASLGEGWGRSVHPDDRAAVFERWRQCAADGSEFDMEFRTLHADGGVRHVHARARALRSAAGTVTGYVGAVADVTTERAMQAELREREAFFDRTGRLARVGGWEVDLPSGHIRWSEITCAIHDRPPGHQPTLQEALDHYPSPVREQVTELVQRAFQLGEPLSFEHPLVTATGRRIWVRVIGEVQRRGGVPVRLMGAIQDISALHDAVTELEREHELRQQVERHARELDALLEERGRMLDVLAHEVRQPINNAQAALQSAAALLAGRGEHEASERLDRALGVLGNVQAGIDNTLAVAALLAGGQPVRRADADIDTMVAVAIADMPLAERARVRVQRETRTRTAEMDMGLMRLALRNLLSNALKYSPPGSPVRLRIADSDAPLALLIDVIDEGPGIEPAFVPQMFERGARGERALGRPGHGLGLYITRRALELQGGRVELLASGPEGTAMRIVLAQGGADE